MSEQIIPTDPDPEQVPDVPAELLRPIGDRVADAVADKARRMAEMRSKPR